MPTQTTQYEIIAVSIAELREFGCPYCGYRSGSTPITTRGTATWRCGSEECRKTCCALADGLTESVIGFGDTRDEKELFYPKLRDHPRRGTPAHGRPDKRPEGGGEFFSCRGIGLDNTPGCFVCGGANDLRANIAAFVQCRDAGKRVVKMFKTGARLDYRPSEPDRVQVKIGACKKHENNLSLLENLTEGQGRVITAEHIAQAQE